MPQNLRPATVSSVPHSPFDHPPVPLPFDRLRAGSGQEGGEKPNTGTPPCPRPRRLGALPIRCIRRALEARFPRSRSHGRTPCAHGPLRGSGSPTPGWVGRAWPLRQAQGRLCTHSLAQTDCGRKRGRALAGPLVNDGDAPAGHGPAPTRQRRTTVVRRRGRALAGLLVNDGDAPQSATLPFVGQGPCPCPFDRRIGAIQDSHGPELA